MRKVTLIAIALLAVSSFAFAGEAQIAKGKVDAVAGNTVTIVGDDGEALSFDVTDKTKVVAEGASHKTASLAAFGQKATMDEFVREGQFVTIKYWEKEGTRYISNLRVH